ncbi:hypothetical protein QOZ80_4BG0349940 [Eleusine coracana subsp. coracana]|nr:hypothetical protein QOZ80_4BG0349940 [Eleusine coracana subsp. coracana]
MPSSDDVNGITPIPPLPPPPVYDPDHLSQDPADRLPIISYPLKDQDAVRRAYIMKQPFKPYAHEFVKRKIGIRDRSFNVFWLYKYPWLEYSIKNDAAYCFVCFLFKKEGHKSAFTDGGWRNWNRDDALDKHVGKVDSAYNAAHKRYTSYLTAIVSIISMYPAIIDVLISLGEDNAQKSDWPKIRFLLLVMESFDFIFSAHLMLTILGYTNELSLCLQRRDQDIVNALSRVVVVSNRMQQLRTNGDHLGIIQFKQMMIAFEDKSILASLIKSYKNLILDLMRLI